LHQRRYPGLKLAWQALRAPSGATAVLNAANEVAVEAFLKRQIRFDQIHQVNQQTLEGASMSTPVNLEDLLEIDARARENAARRIQKIRSA
jgi:1-deoxy-D-xylulose-5-phosphate reductoisomerase